jgi:hypothetical protein
VEHGFWIQELALDTQSVIIVNSTMTSAIIVNSSNGIIESEAYHKLIYVPTIASISKLHSHHKISLKLSTVFIFLPRKQNLNRRAESISSCLPTNQPWQVLRAPNSTSFNGSIPSVERSKGNLKTILIKFRCAFILSPEP